MKLYQSETTQHFLNCYKCYEAVPYTVIPWKSVRILMPMKKLQIIFVFLWFTRPWYLTLKITSFSCSVSSGREEWNSNTCKFLVKSTSFKMRRSKKLLCCRKSIIEDAEEIKKLLKKYGINLNERKTFTKLQFCLTFTK